VRLPLLLGPRVAHASSVGAAIFTGGAGTVTLGGVVFARQGGQVTLAVATSAETQCVAVTGPGGFLDTQFSPSAPKTTWSFGPYTVGSGDGLRPFTATAFPTVVPGTGCAGTADSKNAFYVADNTGPVVTAALSPAPNAAGWNNTNVAITWSAVDAASGVSAGPSPAAESVTSNSSGDVRTSTATDRLGNAASGLVTVKLDKDAPAIIGARSPFANAFGWNNTSVDVSFVCVDQLALSHIKSCTGPTTLSAEGANQSVAGTAVDNAGNTASTTVGPINIDKTPPTLTGTPATSPNADGWYNADVAIVWTGTDALSGIYPGTFTGGNTITGEGTGLSIGGSVLDRAGNQATAQSSPPVKIDRTPPSTSATAPSGWNNTTVTITLAAADNLSGVKTTIFGVDTPPAQVGNTVTIASEGVHTLYFRSVDKAGNVEPLHVVQVKIDKTPPVIGHTQSPEPNAGGWNNSSVTVTFICTDPPLADGKPPSGIASCTGGAAGLTVSSEGLAQPVTGIATDNAGNTATDPATVSIDKTPPAIGIAGDREPNANGWYNAAVTLSFTCGDALSGVISCPAPQTLGEGASQQVSGTTTDAAGNTANASKTGINVDQTPPTLSGAATTSPNANGWYRGDVVIAWSCSDALSGIDGACPASSSLTGEGSSISASATVPDKAGNATSRTVSGIRIDRAAPSTFASVAGTQLNGWYVAPAMITLSTGPDLSGVDQTYYAVDGGAPQLYAGPFAHALGGTHTISFWSTDLAGNVENGAAPGNSITLKADKTPPALAPTISGGTALLLNQPATASPNASDGETGLASSSCGTIDTSSSGAKMVTCTATDAAGNSASATLAYTVGFAVQALYDQVRPAKSGSVLPIKVQLIDVNGTNVSSTAISLHVESVARVSGEVADLDPDDAGNANPGDAFRYDTGLRGYVFNLATGGPPALTTGTYALTFTVSGDPTLHQVQFAVK